ncbi:MAG: hypothetical protein ACT4OY_07560 [Alphaproteobacteria bacterium]
MRPLLVKAVLWTALAVFALAGAAPRAEAVYYVKKKKTESAPVVTAPRAQPQRGQQQAPSAVLPVERALNSSFGPCTENDIVTLRALKTAHENSSTERALEGLTDRRGRDRKKSSEPGLESLAAFYEVPGNIGQVALMTLRCDGIALDAKPGKAKKTRKK